MVVPPGSDAGALLVRRSACLFCILFICSIHLYATCGLCHPHYVHRVQLARGRKILMVLPPAHSLCQVCCLYRYLWFFRPLTHCASSTCRPYERYNPNSRPIHVALFLYENPCSSSIPPARPMRNSRGNARKGSALENILYFITIPSLMSVCEEAPLPVAASYAKCSLTSVENPKHTQYIHCRYIKNTNQQEDLVSISTLNSIAAYGME